MRQVRTLVIGLLCLLASGLHAKPSGPSLLCDTWPDTAECRGQLPSCSVCHTSTWPPAWNAFGLDLLTALAGQPFDAGVASALESIANNDPDGDGVASLTELNEGTAPGDSLSFGGYGPTYGAQPNPWFEVDGYDANFAYRRVLLIFCGRSPTYDERAEFLTTSGDSIATQDRLHAVLTECLASDYWRDVQVPKMAHRRIRPITEVGYDSSVGIVIGDYEWDYRLFTYILTGGRDLRELLTADYHVVSTGDKLEPVTGEIPAEGAPASGNPLAPERRAGMLTTRWFFAINTMFSALPRTAAAQAYREYLGMDLALSEGIAPVAGEPLDVDSKGVAAAPCSHCHSTLDPLSYAFAEYNGIAGPNTGLYQPLRPSVVIPGWPNPDNVLLGDPVDDLVAWAELAAESDAFRKAMADMLFRLVLDRDAEWDEVAELFALADALPDIGYSADALLHLLIDTHAFGAP